MLDAADEAPLYPVEDFSDHLSLLLGVMGEKDELLALAARADDLLAERGGSAAAGEKALDRAVKLLERDQPIAAIRELQKAKSKWFSNERLGSMVRVLLLLAEQYRRLGLAYASKYYAMAAAFIARHQDPGRLAAMLPEALLDLLDAEDVAGNSLGVMQIFPLVVTEHVQNASEPLDTFEHPRIQENLGQISALLGLLKRGNPAAHGEVDRALVYYPPELLGPIRKAAEDREGFWRHGTWNDAWAKFEEVLLDRPFGDLGSQRRVSWLALGIYFVAEFANDYRNTPGAEQFLAEIQLLACGLGGRELGIVPCSLTLHLSCGDGSGKLEFEFPDEARCTVDVRLPERDRGPEDVKDGALLFWSIVRCCSALQDRALAAALDMSASDSMFVVRPYAELFRENLPEPSFAEAVRTMAPPLEPGREFRSRGGERVPWQDGPGPTYDPARAVGDAENRYRVTTAALRNTLPHLLSYPPVRATLVEMHERGMKDWEILSILCNIAVSHRTALDGDMMLEQQLQRAMELMNSPEPEGEALEPNLFGPEAIRLFSEVYGSAFAASWELRIPECYSPPGLERFLVARYGLRNDDVEHEDVFGWRHAALNS